MIRRFSLTTLLICCSMALAQAGKTAQPDPWIGKWKLDLSKSKFHGPTPREEMITLESANVDSMRYSVTGNGPDGAPFLQDFDGKADGKEYPLMRNGLEVARISYHRNADRIITCKGTVADGSSFTESAVISADGKTLTVNQHITNKDTEYDVLVVFHKL